jgi:hypothetical protein
MCDEFGGSGASRQFVAKPSTKFRTRKRAQFGRDGEQFRNAGIHAGNRSVGIS